MVTIKIEKKETYLILGIAVFFLGVVFVIAGSGNPSLHGHPLDELGLPNCAEGEILKKSGGTWQCTPFSGGGGGNILVLEGKVDNFDGWFATDACRSRGKQCVAVVSTNFIHYAPSFPDLLKAIRICGTYYNNDASTHDTNSLNKGNEPFSNFHYCPGMLIGEYTTYLEPGVIECRAIFSAICQ